jgi:hypothetical protein
MFKKVSAGDAIEITASEWNAMLDAAEAEINRRGGQSAWPLKSSLPAGCAWAVNHTGETILAGAVLAVAGFAMPPPDLVAGFAMPPPDLVAAPVVKAATPAPEDRRHLGVAIEDCPPAAVFRLRLHGPALVKLAAAPTADKHCLGIGDDGAAVPADNGLARIVTSITADDVILALVILGCGQPGIAAKRGMFQLLNVTAAAGAPTVRICDGAMPDSAIAGVANVNNQSYSCPAADFALTAAPQYFYFKFTSPRVGVNQETGENEPTPSACEIVAFPDDSPVVSTDSVVYRLIGHAWTEQAEPGGEPGSEPPPPPVVKLVQDHPVGNLIISWFGPCLNLLSGVTD